MNVQLSIMVMLSSWEFLTDNSHSDIRAESQTSNILKFSQNPPSKPPLLKPPRLPPRGSSYRQQHAGRRCGPCRHPH